jgi:NAD(P)-dependent dehydrogenase (short-subunit alcohol dehydrogenase family)
MDLASPVSVDAWLARLDRRVDILVNNAGVNRLGSSAEITGAEFAALLQVNLIAPLRLIAAIADRMKQQSYGRIVNIGSIWGSVSRERRVAYSASKAGLMGLTRALAIELAPWNILVNLVAPGYVDTDLTRQNNSPAEIQAIEQTIPLRRLAKPEEIAECVAFLCSERNTYVTGQALTVDGGFTCK